MFVTEILRTPKLTEESQGEKTLVPALEAPYTEIFASWNGYSSSALQKYTYFVAAKSLILKRLDARPTLTLNLRNLDPRNSVLNMAHWLQTTNCGLCAVFLPYLWSSIRIYEHEPPLHGRYIWPLSTTERTGGSLLYVFLQCPPVPPLNIHHAATCSHSGLHG